MWSFKNISSTVLAISRYQVMLLPIRGLRHDKITGRNKLKDFSRTRRTTLGPTNLWAPSPGITWNTTWLSSSLFNSGEDNVIFLLFYPTSLVFGENIKRGRSVGMNSDQMNRSRFADQREKLTL